MKCGAEISTGLSPVNAEKIFGRLSDCKVMILGAGETSEMTAGALQARGFSAIWRTGAPVYDPAVKQAFGYGPADKLIGFIYAGTPRQALNRMKPPTY